MPPPAPNPTRDPATEFWNDQLVARERLDAGWMSKDIVRQYINRSIGGERSLWPLEWLAWRYPRGFGRALSVGCGGGGLERSLLDLNLCGTIDAFDGGAFAVRAAQKDAAARGWGDRIHYYVADFNRLVLPEARYDIVFFNQSMHHVARLEQALSAVHRALKNDGLLYLDEYIGPSRHQWNEDRLAVHQAIYSLLPREWRLHDRLPLPVELGDPSEAIRSAEIVQQVSVGFDIVERRDYGGTLLSILVPNIDWNVAPESFQTQLIEAERELLAAGGDPYYTIIVARPKRAFRGRRATVRYFTEPKWRAARVRAARAFGRDVPF